MSEPGNRQPQSAGDDYNRIALHKCRQPHLMDQRQADRAQRFTAKDDDDQRG